MSSWTQLASLILLAQVSIASPILPVDRLPLISENDTTSISSTHPPRGPDRYRALAEHTAIESRELHEYFAHEDALYAADVLGAIKILPGPADLPVNGSRLNGRAAIKNPKVIKNPKWRGAGVSPSKTTSAATTSTTTSASRPSSTAAVCRLTQDCAGQPLPANAHAYCDQDASTCTFRCNKNFVQSGNICTSGAAPTTTTSNTPAKTSAVIPVAVPPSSSPKPTGCFPSSRSDIPTTPATASSLSQWWCPEQEEYAFLGFSYGLYSCPDQRTMTADFKRMKQDYGARYVRLYGNCDASWHNDAWVNAAADAGLGVYALVWFGWDNPNDWKWRMDALVKTILTNPKAPWVVRNVAVGSEPLFDWALDPDSLATQIYSLRQKLSIYGIKTTISEMPYGFQIHNNAPQVFKAIDFVEANILPFFDGSATTGGTAWGMVNWSLDFFRQNAPGKQIRMTQTGWPSNDSVWKANTPTAVASVASQKAYFELLDSQCRNFKDNGRVGYFYHIWSDAQLNGWGLLDWNGNPKFQFNPRTIC